MKQFIRSKAGNLPWWQMGGESYKNVHTYPKTKHPFFRVLSRIYIAHGRVTFATINAGRMSNKYDRILNENFRIPTILLLKKLTGIRSISIMEKQRKMHHTLEKETDTLLLIAPEQGEAFLGDIEWQVTNDPKMVARMLLYHAIGYRLHGYPVKGYVIYIGDEECTMENNLDQENLKYSFTLINLKDIDPEEFMSSDIPEEIILAVLAGRAGSEDKRAQIQKILHKLHKIYTGNSKALSRSLEQLEVLSNLRNVQQIIIEEEENMAIVYDLNTDIRYNQGLEIGMERTRIEKDTTFVKNLLLKTKMSDKEIAEAAEVTVEFVGTVKSELPL